MRKKVIVAVEGLGVELLGSARGAARDTERRTRLEGGGVERRGRSARRAQRTVVTSKLGRCKVRLWSMSVEVRLRVAARLREPPHVGHAPPQTAPLGPLHRTRPTTLRLGLELSGLKLYHSLCRKRSLGASPGLGDRYDRGGREGYADARACVDEDQGRILCANQSMQWRGGHSMCVRVRVGVTKS